MPRGEKVYRRLPGRESGLLSYSRLWLGPDHLLLARTTFFSEEYKRFYFRDIQALIVRKTERREILNVIFALVAIAFGLFVLASPDSFWRGFWVVFAGLVLCLLAVNWLRGPTCVCHIRTAVQTEPLPTLKHLRTARKVIARLKPGIEAAQGPLAPGHGQAKAPATSSIVPSTPAVQTSGAADRPPPTTFTP